MKVSNTSTMDLALLPDVLNMPTVRPKQDGQCTQKILHIQKQNIVTHNFGDCACFAFQITDTYEVTVIQEE
jgi:hypothetical protein